MQTDYRTWNPLTLAKLAEDLVVANEQLRQDNRDLSRLLREANAKLAAYQDDLK
jgi:hypothetical protein